MTFKWYSTFVIITLYSFATSHRNNVCKTFSDYATIDTNKNCWYNPDVDLPPPSIAKRYGYPMKKYRVTTDDGYILTLFRIPHNGIHTNVTRQPIIVQHGLAGSAIFWMMQQKKSIAFVLVDNGYDVWLPTIRGSGYSRQHVRLTTADPSYWNFGIHELGVYDLPAIVESVANVTGQKGNIIYMGHSMGTTMSYIYFSMNKLQAESNLRALISLSPVAYMKHIEGWHKTAIVVLDLAVQFLQRSGIPYLGGMPAVNNIIYSFCGSYPGILLCEAFSTIGTGLAHNQVKPDAIPVFMKHYPTATSLKVLRHFFQIILSGGSFKQYDYNFDNMARYKSPVPPLYNVTNIQIPVHLFIGTQDILACDRDVDILYEKLNYPGSETKASKYFFDFAHNDFFLGADPDAFYKVLLDVIKNKIGNK